MNLKQLEAFLCVAEHKSFTKAAKQLYMSQPAISFQIKSLEESLGVALFQRNEKRVELTEAGRFLHAEAKEILYHFYKIKSGLEDLKGLKTGHLIIGASTIPGEYILPLLIGKFRQSYPGIKISLRIGGSGDVESWLYNKEIDLGFTGVPIKSKELECIKWLDDHLALIVHPDHPWNAKGKVKVKELLEQPFIMREPGSGTRRTFEAKLAEKDISLNQLNIVMELGSTRAVITAVQAGLGISVVSPWSVRESLVLGYVHKVFLSDLEFNRYLYVIKNQKWLDNFATSAFLGFIYSKDALIQLNL